jgi:hypothetical protein
MPVHRFRPLVVLLACAMLAALLPAAARAQVSGMVWYTLTRFEDAPDGAPIAASLPGLRFSASDGAQWLYGDVRSGRYNAPYPLPCPDFGAECAFAVNGNGFAWLGELPGVGRIDILDPTVTYVSAGFSTAEPLIVSAFSADGSPVDEQTVAPNLATGRLDPATLTAPAGRSIAYLLIRGGANRWIMDDLVIGNNQGLPPRPGQPPAERPAEPAFVTVVQRAAPNRTAAPDSRISLTIEVVNRGRGAARETMLILELNPQVVRLLDATFSTSAAWVSDLTPAAVTIRTGALPAASVVTITLDLYVLPSALIHTPIGGALQARWFDAAKGGTNSANLPVVVVGAVSGASDTLPLDVRATAPDAVTLTAAFFAPQEPVGIWYDTGGDVMSLTTLRADAAGRVVFTLDARDLPAGGSFVAAGHWSGLNGLGRLIDPPDS